MGRMEVACGDTQGVVSSPVCDQTIHSAADSRRLMMYFAGEALTRDLSACWAKPSSTRYGSSRPWTSPAAPGAACALGHSRGRGARPQRRAAANPLAMAQSSNSAGGVGLRPPHNYSHLLHRRSTLSPRSVRRALDDIHANLHLPITAEQLTAAAGVPGERLECYFRHATGLAPLAYVVEGSLRAGAP